MHSDLICPSGRNQDAFMLGEETDMTVYDNIDDETNEFDQNDESEQPDEVIDIQEDEAPDAYENEIDDLNHNDLPDYDETMDQIDEADNFLLEEVVHDDFDDFLEQSWLFQPLDDTADVDVDMDTGSFIDLDEHVDSLVFDMNDTYFSDDKGSIDLDGSYDPLKDDLIDEID